MPTAAPRRATKETPPRDGQRWRNPRGDEVEVLGASPHAAGRLVWIRDKYGPAGIDPAVLRTFELIQDSDQPEIKAPAPVQHKAEPPLPSNPDERPPSSAQMNYLRSLCEQLDQPLPGELTRKQVSAEIDRLKKLRTEQALARESVPA